MLTLSSEPWGVTAVQSLSLSLPTSQRLHYDDYDRLIQLCRRFSPASMVSALLEKRLI